MFVQPKKNDTPKYHIDYTYDEDHDCEAYGCDCICRCGTITDVRVNDNLNSWLGMLGWCWKPSGKTNTIEDVLALRFIKNTFKSDAFHCGIQDDYYGQVVGDITFDDPKFWQLADAFNQASVTDKLQMVLQLEYGLILPKLKNVTDWELVQVSKDDVLSLHAPNKNRVKEYKDYIDQRGYHNDPSWYREILKQYAPIVTESSGKYAIIDGHHRWAALSEKYKYFVTRKETATKKRKIKNKNAYKTWTVEQTYHDTKWYVPDGVWVIRPKA